MYEIFILNFITMFIVVDPLGTACVYASITGHIEDINRKKIAFRAFLMATIILSTFAILSTYVLSLIGDYIGIIGILGGALLMITVWRMIIGYKQFNNEDNVLNNKNTLKVAYFPLSIPLLAGPGCILTVMFCMNNAPSPEAKFIVLVAVILVEIIALIFMLGGARLSNYLGNKGMKILEKIMATFLGLIASHLILEGYLSFLK